MFVRSFGGAIFIASVGLAALAAAQQPAATTRPYDGIQAGLDAFRLAEEKRQAAVSQQLFLNDQMRFWNGYPTSRGETIYYGYMSPGAMYAFGYGGPYAGYSAPANGYAAAANGYAGYAAPLMTRANLDYVYAYGAGPLWGGYRSAGGWLGPLAVFQPWPYVPGDIYGYRAYYQPARQPIGQTQLQTGPNRWESHPVYDPPLTNYQPLPPVDSPLLDRTPYAAPPAVLPPGESVPPAPPATSPAAAEATPPGPPTNSAPPAPRRGPREY